MARLSDHMQTSGACMLSQGCGVELDTLSESCRQAHTFAVSETTTRKSDCRIT